ncbi:MAG TPA: tRNA uridine-5-carboxymethylaminomethyl(34) synthesis GTPase MnmE, partial [Sphingomonas sp.]
MAAVPDNSGADGFDTIYALSSGRPPAAIAIVRVSGAGAGAIVTALAGRCPPARQAALRTLRDRSGDVLDRALVLWFPDPRSATGEDLAEFHLHGGRAVVDAVLEAIGQADCRPAEPGEFTRRALLNGRLDLEGVEGLSDLLAAETEYQRREALRRSDGALGRRIGRWSETLLSIAARYEAAIDYDGDIEPDEDGVRADMTALVGDIDDALSRISAERLRDGLRVAIVGAANAGKSSLFNALVGSEAAIVSALPGTTRDLIERPIAMAGIPFILIDTAGLRESAGEIERIGIDRAIAARSSADIILDLEASSGAGVLIAVTAKIDRQPLRPGTIGVSALTGEGIATLCDAIVSVAKAMLPGEGDAALNRRYRLGVAAVREDLTAALAIAEPLLAAEHIRLARENLDRLSGTAGFEDML